MKLLYGKTFSKDLDPIHHQTKIKAQLFEVIEMIRAADSLNDLKGVTKIQGYHAYFRIKVADYRLGIKVKQNTVELIRFLHRKDIYRRFP